MESKPSRGRGGYQGGNKNSYISRGKAGYAVLNQKQQKQQSKKDTRYNTSGQQDNMSVMVESFKNKFNLQPNQSQPSSGATAYNNHSNFR